MNKDQIMELLVQLEKRNVTNLRLWQMYDEEGNHEQAQRYFGQHSGLDEAIREIRKAANIDYLDHIANCVARDIASN